MRRIQQLGQRRSIVARWIPRRGKGSHGLLYYGSQITTVRCLKDEVDKRAFHSMLRQLGLAADDLKG